MAVGPESESNMMVELSAMGTSQKSFYGKAFAELTDKGNVGWGEVTSPVGWMEFHHPETYQYPAVAGVA